MGHRVALVWCPRCQWVRAIQIHAHTGTQEKRAGTLHGMEQNRLFRREESGGEDACGADWYSLQLICVDTSSLPLTAEREATRGGRESLTVIGNTDPTSPLPHPICIPQLPDGPLCLPQFYIRVQTKRNRSSRLQFPKCLLSRRPYLPFSPNMAFLDWINSPLTLPTSAGPADCQSIKQDSIRINMRPSVG